MIKVLLTPEEEKNGWTPETLGAYLESREQGKPIGGFVVVETERVDRKPFPVHESALRSGAHYSPHRWRVRRS